ncbi:MAG: helix-turn-helix transcriptional regulator [Clostridia bacterium]|nr:helix-turn-helix transcriptional regulator [Clostridia bacterium]
MELGRNIREFRKEKNWTQAELAKRLFISQDTISLWELNKSLPDLNSLLKLCDLFDVTPDYLLGFK